MEVTGDFNSFYSFLLELEKLPRIMKIRELELKKETASGGANNSQLYSEYIFPEAHSR